MISAVLANVPVLAQVGSSAAPASPSPQNAGTQPQTAAPSASSGQPQAKLPTPAAPLRLTLQDAEAIALKSNPQISVYRLLALASAQVTREQKAAYYPNLYGSLTGVAANEGGR